MSNHKAIVREEFTRQADAYACAAVIADENRLARLVSAMLPEAIIGQLKSQQARAMSRWP